MELLFYVKIALIFCQTCSLWTMPSLGLQQCTNVYPVGVANSSVIPDVAMTASTAFRKSVDYLTARYGRLHSKRAWCPSTLDGDDWLQVDLGSLYYVCGVVTQGKVMSTDEWATNYTITWSRDAVTWVNYTENGQLKVFEGSRDGPTEVANSFAGKLWLRYIRFHPIGYHLWPCLRVEINVELTPSTISVKPAKQRLAVGDTLLLNCLPSGSPLPEVAWTLNGNEIIFGRKLGNGSLLVPAVENDKNFEGLYKCEAKSRVSVATSSAEVSIHAKPVILNPLPQTTSVLRGKTIALSCYATGDPAPHISWYKDDAIVPRARIHSNGHVLIIPSMTSQDAGVYKCKASNFLGRPISSTNLTMLDVPTINTILTPKTVYAKTSEQASIGCYAESVLPLNYSWSKGGVTITASSHGNSHVIVQGNVLAITPRSDEDFGTHTCVVSNAVDSVSYDIKLVSVEMACDDSLALESGRECLRNHLEIVLPLMFLIFLSVAINFYLVYRLCRTGKDPANHGPIQMNALRQQDRPGSHLMKDTEIAWDNLIPEEPFPDGDPRGDANCEINLDEEGRGYHDDEGDKVQLVRPMA